MSAADEFDALRERRRYFTSVDYGYRDKTAVCVGYLDARGHVYITDSYTTEEPKMKLEDALTIARYGKRRFGDGPRAALYDAAFAQLRDHAEKLLYEAEKKAEAERVLVDIGVLDLRNGFASVRRWFSDGTFTEVVEPRPLAEQIKYAFNQGKKAEQLRANTSCCPGPT